MDAKAEDLAAALEQPPVDANGVDDVLFGEERQARRDAPEDLDLDDVVVDRAAGVVARLAVGARAAQVLRHVVRRRRPERAGLHVLAGEVPLPLERAEVIVHPVRRTDPHPRTDLTQRRRVAAVGDGLPDEVQDHLLALCKTLHGVQPTEHAYPSQARGEGSRKRWGKLGGIRWALTPARGALRAHFAFAQTSRNFGSKGSPWHCSHECSFLSARFSLFT